ncbi:DNase I-like protein [Microthyrium microscopicum]|uniref:DNase I-like protein n=1 Tax=Microthyrium microscopicum TaxID=703497 RepID=A0A6A6U9L9_9PEZI|nr:DNase I-like protein [Microthyrium microscopicum]
MSSSRRSTNASEAPTPSDVPGSFPNDSELSSQQSLAQAVYARRSEYIKPQKIRVKIGSWNVGNHDAARDIGAWFLDGKGVDSTFSRLNLNVEDDIQQAKNGESQESGDTEGVREQEARTSLSLKSESTVPVGDRGDLPGGEDIGLYVLGLQEIVDVTSPTEALRPYTDPAPANKFKDALTGALPKGYELVAEQQLMGLLLLIYASPEVLKDVRSSCTTSVGTGLMGYMGNKGAVTSHLILGETTRLAFINCHLGAGAEKGSLERRNWDASQIVARTRFDKVEDPSGVPNSGEQIGDEDFAFWFGDLNYRLEGIPGDDVRHLLTLHTRNEYDLEMAQQREREEEAARQAEAKENSSNEVPEDLDPASLQTTLSSLLPHDELMQQIKLRKSLSEGWKEGPIRFLPTYKYDVGTVAVFDTSEKKRAPSWCDRILYRTRKDYDKWRKRVQDEEAARKRDEEMKSRGLGAEDDDNVIFDYNPDEDGDDMFEAPTLEQVTTRDGSEDEILLEHYTSHQRVLSSDHKPLDAVFTLTYQAVDHDKKAKVHAEVTRILDRNENEGRPTVTVVFDHSKEPESPSSSCDTQNVDGVINFGPMRMGKGRHRHITVANTGAVAATVGLVDRPVSGLGEEGSTPPWLIATFDREPDAGGKKKSKERVYTLEPGDVVNLELVARVEAMAMARDLDDGVMRLDDVLILRVRDGRDHFLPVQGTWVRSSLERSIDALKRLPEDGIRKLQNQKPIGSPGRLFGFGSKDG